MNFFTSDNHFSHKRVIDFSQRPFKDLKHMEHELIKRWNKKVKDEDTVYIVGDFNFKGTVERQVLWSKLKGNKVLIRGNHDSSGILLGCFVSFGGKGWEVVHNPEDSTHSYVIHGHIHKPTQTTPLRIIDQRVLVNVNVELWDYEPVSLKQITQLIKKIK